MIHVIGLLYLSTLVTLSNHSSSANNTTVNISKYVNGLSNITNKTLGKLVDKELIVKISNLSTEIAKKVAPYVHLTPNEFKLLEFFIFMLIIVFLADLISKFGKFIILILGVTLAALIYYNHPGHVIWSLIILFITALVWFKK